MTNFHDDTPDTPSAQLRAAAVGLMAKGKSELANAARDLADRCERYGGFVSDRQAAFARNLIAWGVAAPRVQSNGNGQHVCVLSQLSTLFQPGGLARLNWRQWELKAARDRITTWILHRGVCVGKMTTGGKVYRTRNGANAEFTELQELDLHPMESMREHGLESGRCCICNRELTDPESISAGIGPVCAGRASGILFGRGQP